MRLLGSFEEAEEADHDAFVAAAEQWPRDGVPANPVGWPVSVGRFKAIDRLRRHARFASIDDHAEMIELIPDPAFGQHELESIADDRLRLIFTCCHPSLLEEARISLTLREVGSLITEEIARSFLMTTSTLAQRIVWAKAIIRDARIPYAVPSRTGSLHASPACCG